MWCCSSGILDLADTRKVTKTTFTELVDQPQIFLHVYKDPLRAKDSITGVFVWGISFRVNPPFHIDDLWIWLLRVVPLSLVTDTQIKKEMKEKWIFPQYLIGWMFSSFT